MPGAQAHLSPAGGIVGLHPVLKVCGFLPDRPLLFSHALEEAAFIVYLHACL